MTDEFSKDSPSDPDAETLESQPERTRGGMPREIGRYKVRRTIGSGGMGTVYEAIQESPRRKVAIKVMRSGVTSRSAMRRFEYESQILGRLSHPCIAQVFEAGTYDDGTGGVPYFAMEYIVGAKTLLEYAKQKDLKVHERLVLFEQICDAVHHGHLKGIIHRDLKPDNILIDSSGNPKIIDFGVARATDSDMALTTLQTNVGQLIGTVQYMSPEQCEADPDLIDARSDVYSLGVILYELLTGQPPYDLSSIPIYEATRLIREQQPTKMTTIAQGIQGDLETVVSKAMDKDRDRRYQSSYELGQDITRFLENEPIHARRASMVYQLKMFARRNRAVVATVITIGIALVLATVVSVYAGIRASQAEAKAIVDRDRAVAAEHAVTSERDRALVAEQAATVDRDRAVAAERVANDALVRAEESQRKTQIAMDESREIFQMLISIAEFNKDILALGAPRNAQGESLSVHDILLYATDEITKRFGDNPQLEAPVRRSIGELLWEMGDLEHAREQLGRSLEVFNAMTDINRVVEQLQTATAYVKVLLDLGEHENARKRILKIIEECEQFLPEGSSSTEFLTAKDVLGDIMHFTMEDNEETLELRREVLAAIDAGVQVTREFELDARVKLAGALLISYAMLDGTFSAELFLQEGMAIVEGILPIVEEELGILHPVSIDARLILATCYFLDNRIMESVPLLEKVYEDAKKVFGASHLKTAEAASVLGTFYFFIGQSQSEPLLHEAIEIYASHVDNNHPAVLNVKSKLGQLLVNFGRFDEAETLLRENMLELSESWDADSVYRIETVGSLAYALMMQGKFEEGNPLLQEVIDALLNPEQGEMNPAVGRLRFIRAHAYILHHHPEADKTVDEFIASWTETFGPNDTQLLLFTQLFCKSYFDVDEPDRGIEVATHLFVQIREYEDSNAKDLLNILKMESGLAALCVKAYKSDEALELLGRIIPALEEESGPTHKSVVVMEMLRAQAKAQLGQLDESIALFTSLHEDLVEAIGSEAELTKRVENGRINNLIDLERWDATDTLMQERMNRYFNDAELLMDMSKNIITNGHEGYRHRYLGIALEAAERAVFIRGEDNPDATYRLAGVYAALGEYEEALNWMTKTIAFAGEDHEKLEKFREKLTQLNTLIKTGIFDIQIDTYEDQY